MSILFESNRGRVVQLDDPAASGRMNFLKVTPKISYSSHFSIITRMTLSSQVNVQFLHTIGSHIYIYVFGDRIGQMTLSGLAFSDACDAGGRYGPEEILKWYRENKASRRQSPVQIMIGNTPVECFITNFNQDVVDPSTNLVQWTIAAATLPEDGGGGGGFAMAGEPTQNTGGIV